MDTIHSNFLTSWLAKNVFTWMGGVVALFEPTIPFIIICTLAVLFDCFTAWSLSRRVKKKYPGANDGKFKSHYAGRVFVTLIKIYALIILTHMMDVWILPGEFTLALPNIVAGSICFWQIWSMLENESSCNDAKWARIAQKILVNKTERHFDIDLSELKHDDDDDQRTTTNTQENGNI